MIHPAWMLVPLVLLATVVLALTLPRYKRRMSEAEEENFSRDLLKDQRCPACGAGGRFHHFVFRSDPMQHVEGAGCWAHSADCPECDFRLNRKYAGWTGVVYPDRNSGDFTPQPPRRVIIDPHTDGKFMEGQADGKDGG